jgi:hypothetical protein
LVPSGPRPHRLLDGSLIGIEWASYGTTNVFADGSFLQKVCGALLERFNIKATGSLAPPSRRFFSDPEGILVLRFYLKNAEARVSPFFVDPHRRPRTIVTDTKTGHRYLGYTSEFQKSRNGRDWHSYVTMTSFPRAQKYLQCDLHDEHGKVLGRLSLKNPAYLRRKPVTPLPSPATITIGNVDVTFGQREFPQEPPPGSFAGMPIALLNLKISRAGLALTNWRVADTTWRDSYGNHQFINAVKTLTNDWQQYRVWRFLDRAHAWKVRFSVTKDTNFTPEELCTFEVKYPLPAPKIELCHGRRLQVSFVNTDMLSVDLLDTNENVRLTFIEVTDPQGNDLYSGSGSWRQHGFWRGLQHQRRVDGVLHIDSSIKPGTVARVTVAIHTNYPAEYIFPPHPQAIRLSR